MRKRIRRGKRRKHPSPHKDHRPGSLWLLRKQKRYRSARDLSPQPS